MHAKIRIFSNGARIRISFYILVIPFGYLCTRYITILDIFLIRKKLILNNLTKRIRITLFHARIRRLKPDFENVSPIISY